MAHDDVKEVCTFQLVSAKDGIRSEPFTLSFLDACEYLEKNTPPDEFEQHYVLVLIERADDNEMLSRRPLIYVKTFISLVQELSK